jgi:hypothetical protein
MSIKNRYLTIKYDIMNIKNAERIPISPLNLRRPDNKPVIEPKKTLNQ